MHEICGKKIFHDTSPSVPEPKLLKKKTVYVYQNLPEWLRSHRLEHTKKNTTNKNTATICLLSNKPKPKTRNQNGMFVSDSPGGSSMELPYRFHPRFPANMAKLTLWLKNRLAEHVEKTHSLQATKWHKSPACSSSSALAPLDKSVSLSANAKKKIRCSTHSVPKIERTIKLQPHSGKIYWSIFQPTMLVQGCVARFNLKCCHLQLHNSRTRRRDFFLEGRCTKSVRSELYPPGN